MKPNASEGLTKNCFLGTSSGSDRERKSGGGYAINKSAPAGYECRAQGGGNN